MSDADAPTHGAPNEMLHPNGAVRTHYGAFAHWLAAQSEEAMAARQLEADINFRRIGITFSVAGDADGTERLIPFDLIPRIIPSTEWQQLDLGLKQRVYPVPSRQRRTARLPASRRHKHFRAQPPAQHAAITCLGHPGRRPCSASARGREHRHAHGRPQPSGWRTTRHPGAGCFHELTFAADRR